MRILITGVNGFVGAHLITYLLENQPDAEIVGLVHDQSLSNVSDNVRVVRGDIRDADRMYRILQQEQPDHIYHLAGAASGAGQDREAINQVNVAGVRNVMSAAANEVPKARILFASSGYVYGNSGDGGLSHENDPLNPIGLYAESKRDAEPYAVDAGAIVARAFNHTGPGQTVAFAIPAFASQIAAIEHGTQPLELGVGNLDAQRDFLDVRDVVRAYFLLLRDGELGGIYNVCRGQSFSMRTLLERLLSFSTLPISVHPDQQRMRPSDVPFSAGNPSRLQRLTDWAPEISLNQTLLDTLNWWRAIYIAS